ncbi:thioredoxin domain-containing protein 16 [Sardina pilchardus]|uniref:thioredoxin domain-containing protein 16 n=1 Tax=Sardina pilchardus TaxID=27697 RepID=UPI002E1163AF
METAFVYGAKFQFVLTTGGPVLKHMGVDDPVSLQAGLWFLHCKEVMRAAEPCPHTAMRRPLTTLNIYAFLQLMEAPLLTEAWVDPAQVEVDYRHLHVPLLFVFTQAQTESLDRATAEALAWRLRGEVGVVLVHRDSPDVQTPAKYNAAYRLSDMAAVKYVTFNNLEEVVTLFKEEVAPVGEEEVAEEEEEDEEDQWTTLDVLDDEVAESVYRDRDQMLDLEPVIELTEDTFTSALAQHDHLVVLFFIKWDAVSMAFLHSFVEVSEALEDLPDVALASVDCGEWTDVCGARQINSFPSVVAYRRGDGAQLYRGMMGSESLHRFILLSRLGSPLRLASSEEVRSFLEGASDEPLGALAPVRALGAFSSGRDSGVPLFEDAARELRGEVLLGLFVDTAAQNWARELSVDLPALLVCRGSGGPTEVHSLQPSSLEELLTLIRRATLDPFPELTVENLPQYLELQKPLLLLFVTEDGPESSAALLEMQGLSHAGHLQSYLPCWINLRRTPAGSSVLESYLGASPQLPALVLSQLCSNGEVFHFPPQRPLQSGSILQWLHGVERQEEEPAGVVPDERWEPSVPFFDFLSVMDEELPGYAAQRSPKTKMAAGRGEAHLARRTSKREEVKEEEEEGRKREKDHSERRSSGAPAHTPSPHTHSEL